MTSSLIKIPPTTSSTITAFVCIVLWYEHHRRQIWVKPSFSDETSISILLLHTKEVLRLVYQEIYWSKMASSSIPVRLQSKRSVEGASVPGCLDIASRVVSGNGMLTVIGRWNFRRRGSSVTTGATEAWRPKYFNTSSSETCWTWKGKFI